MVATGVALAPTAQAAPTAGCSGSRCKGLEPTAQGCASDAYTVTSVSTSQGLVELRYSPSCRANWARISNAAPGTWFWVQQCNDGYSEQYYVPSGYTSAYTYMVDGTVLTRAGNAVAHTACL
ncbi:DUF2690 domain-containing protein [Streptomyces sp. NPDC017179]|uniref:DUF2690 domain-containing protein n=1 Tax=Streptomyces sp. NPDC017179 TaxID=3364979 RepID=UPI00378F2A83